ncbi:hypothetical protein JCM18899A_10960 [Nocardioides sp. AN3]
MAVAASLLCPAHAGRELHGRQVGPPVNRIAWSPAGSYVIGDSITAGAASELARRRPDWTINALHGRPVSTLPQLIENVRAVDRHPSRVVIELGSNQTPRWSKADYVSAIARLPASTRVLLVTPYKSPNARWSTTGVQATLRYARWMQQISRQRPHTCAVPWRAVAAAHPQWLRDGLHPTDDGYPRWVELLLKTDSGCR